jgi:small subunit ribosomal protein S9
MTDDEKQPSEDVTPEDTDADGSATGPVAEDDSSSSQAAGEEPTSTPPAEEASESDGAQDEAPQAEQAQDDAPEEEQLQDEAPAEEPADVPVAEQEEDADAEETPAGASDEAAEDADEGSQGDGAPADDGGSEAEQPAVKKKDVIPGADLEPIAVESSEERPLSAEERARKEAEEEERAQREAALTGDGEEEESPASRAPAKMESGSRFQATGKRKRSIARVTLLPGDGKFEINGRGLEEFFPRPLHQTMAKQPLTTTGYETTVDVRIRVHGGGIGGQAGAVRHGISRALTEIDPELRGELKRRGFLTRDARVKERRKAGLKKARKKPQFSKR